MLQRGSWPRYLSRRLCPQSRRSHERTEQLFQLVLRDVFGRRPPGDEQARCRDRIVLTRLKFDGICSSLDAIAGPPNGSPDGTDFTEESLDLHDTRPDE